MADENRYSVWRQGSVFQIPATDDFSVISGTIVSHDCDICADNCIEPNIEYIELDLDAAEDGSLVFGKNPRLLQVKICRNAQAIIINLDIRVRKAIPKSLFFKYAGSFSHQLRDDDIKVLRRWLSGRYARSAFPNAFEVLMGPVQRKIDHLSKKKGNGIRGLYFDLDDDHIIERDEDDDPYELAIYVVYPPDTGDTEATDFAEAIDKIFKEQFFDNIKREWKGVHLLSCNHVSEDIFPLSLAFSTKTWRVDHRSYQAPPLGDLHPEPDR